MTVLTARLHALGFRLISGIPWRLRRALGRALVGMVQGTLVQIIRWGSLWQRARGKGQSADDLARQLTWYAWRRVESRDWSGALLYAKSAIAADAGNAEGYRMLTYVYEGSGSWTSARETCEHGLRVAPDNALLLEELGSLEERADDLTAAEAYWRRAMELRPDEVRISNRLVRMLKRQRRWSEAVPLLQRIAELEPSNAHLVELASAYVNSGAFDQAQPHLERVIASEPLLADAHYWLAMSNAGMNRWDEAIEHAGNAAQLTLDNEHYRKIYDLFRETGGKGIMITPNERSTGEDDTTFERHPPD